MKVFSGLKGQFEVLKDEAASNAMLGLIPCIPSVDAMVPLDSDLSRSSQFWEIPSFLL